MNTELNPSQLLTQLASEQSTGCLELVYGSICWNIFLRFGKLVTADNSIQSVDRSIYRLQQLGYGTAANALKTVPNCREDRSIHQQIDRLALQGLLDREQLGHISAELTKEAFESMLWLTDGKMTWHPNKLMPMTTVLNSYSNLSLSKIIDYYHQRLTIWQKFTNIVQSPHQRPYLTNQKFLEKPVPNGTLSPTALSQIARLMKGLSLRDLALFLKNDELKLVKLLTPYIRQNIICLREPSAPFSDLPTIPEPILSPIESSDELIPIEQDISHEQGESKVYQIACIDDSPLILDEIERFLGDKGKYQLTKFEDPIQASGSIFRLKPDLILMDITMPNINGYNLCSLFRNSEVLAETPIIMVTSNRGFIDKARAKMVGANDYLTKPFSAAELSTTIEKYLS
jgi:two-component system, chemotaxis family, response regulator PixG